MVLQARNSLLFNVGAELNLDISIYYTNSKVALYTGPGERKQFIQTHVDTIRKLVTVKFTLFWLYQCV